MKNHHIILTAANQSGIEYRYSVLGRLITLVMLLCGLFAVEFCFLPFSVASLIACVLSAVPVVGASIIRSDRQWTRMKYGTIIAAVICAIVMPTATVNGFLCFINQVINLWNDKFDMYISAYQIGDVTTFQMTKFWFVFNLLIGLVLCWGIRNKKVEIAGLIGLAIMIISAYMNLAVNPAGYVIFAMGLILSFTGENLFIQKFVRVIPFILGVIIVAVAVSFMTAGFSQSTGINIFQNAVMETVEHIRYGSDTLPEGDLTKACDMVGEKSNRTLEIKGDVKNSLHLRGFVGSSFKDYKWSELSGKSYSGEMAGMLDWLHSKKFESQYQYADYVSVSGTQSKPIGLSVNNVGANRKYVYVPYEIINLKKGSGSPDHDWQIKSDGFFGVKKYDFDMDGVENLAETAVYINIEGKDKKSKDYVNAEAVYKSFVFDNYLDISDEDKALIDEDIFDNKPWDKVELGQLTSKIRLALQTLNTYSADTTVYNGSENFVKWFLSGQKRCNSSYYATIATLSYRSVGVPARYVEGYYIDGTTATQEEGVTVVSQNDSHAWVEIYIDGMGWLPVEVTPGYYATDYNLEGVAPSPDSSVNVVENNDDTLEGTTKDTLGKKKQNEQKSLKLSEKVVHVLGILILVFIILVLLRMILRLQVHIRRNLFYNKINNAEKNVDKCRMIYTRACKILIATGVDVDFRFPHQNIKTLASGFSALSEDEFKKFIFLIEKSIFSGKDLDENEYRTVRLFLDRLTKESYEKGTALQRLKLFYIYAV